MIRYLGRHLNLLILTLLILSIFSFWLAYLFPGDPIANLSGITPQNPEAYAQISAQYQADASLITQYFAYMQRLFAGDWGLSLSSGLSLWDEILLSLPATVELGLYGLFMSLLIGLPLGFWSGVKHYKATDYAILTSSVIGYSLPIFWLSLLLILVFALQLGWFPTSGRISLLYDVPSYTGFLLLDIGLSDIPDKRAALVNAFQHMVLPTLSITIVTSAIVVRLTRRSVIEILPSEFIQAAYTRGLSKTQVFFRHTMRNALLPIIPLLAMQAVTMITNAMIVEVIFSWPGIGNWLIQAIYQQDYPAIRAGMLAVSTLVVILNVSLDLFAKAIDPRQIRIARVSA